MTRRGSSEKTKTALAVAQSSRSVVINSTENRCIYDREKDSRRPLGWNFGTLELEMRANGAVSRDVGSCTSERTLASLKPWKLFVALHTKCRVPSCECY